MDKRSKMDFVLFANDYKKVVFRFYLKDSYWHSFNSTAPVEDRQLYKTYYYWRILDLTDNEILFDSGVDECSALNELAASCNLLLDGIEVFETDDISFPLLDREILSFCGVVYKIHKFRENKYQIEFWNCYSQGYRCIFTIRELRKFTDYLEAIDYNMKCRAVPI